MTRRLSMTRLLAVPFALGAIVPLVGAAGSNANPITLAQLQKALDSGQYQAAKQNSASYLEQHPGNRDARFVHAAALAGLKDNTAAIKEFTALQKDFPLRVEPANDLAVLYAREGEYDKARQTLEKAMATQPGYAAAHQNLGDIYTALADMAYRKALDTDKVAKQVPLKMVDRFYYAGESVAPSSNHPTTPATQPAPATEPSTSRSTPQPTQVAKNDTPKPAQHKPAPAPDPKRVILDTVNRWATAWASQDVETYLGFYATDFDPGNGRTRDQWQALRRKRLKTPEQIHIQISQAKVTLADPQHATATFVQKYNSPRYSDQVTKQLRLTREDGHWRITRETSS